jgi:hypothetical protein
MTTILVCLGNKNEFEKSLPINRAQHNQRAARLYGQHETRKPFVER